MRNGIRHTKLAVFWSRDDPLNTVELMVERADDRTNVAAMIRAIIVAIKQPNYADVISEWAKRNFCSFGGKQMRNAKLLEELHSLLKDVKVDFEYAPTYVDGEPNYVMQAVFASRKYAKEKAVPAEDVRNNQVWSEEAEWSNAPSGSSCPAPDLVPTVYVAARVNVSTARAVSASYATYWIPESLREVPAGKRPIGSTNQLCLCPATLARAHMSGILRALKEAESSELQAVRIITTSYISVHLFNCDWKRADGTPARNKRIYDQIRQLINKLDLSYIQIRSERADPASVGWKKVGERAENGLLYPKFSVDKSEYAMTLEELTKAKSFDGSQDLLTLPRVRIFKRARRCPAGIFWDMANGEPLGVELSGKLCSALNLDELQNADVFLTVLEQAKSFNIQRIVVRTNLGRIVKSIEGSLQIWKRKEWCNSLNKPVANLEKWQRLDELRKDVEIVWDLIKKPNQKLDKPYFAFHRKRKAKRNSRKKEKRKAKRNSRKKEKRKAKRNSRKKEKRKAKRNSRKKERYHV